MEISELQLDSLAYRVADLVTDRLKKLVSRKHVSRQEYADMHGIGLRTVDRMIHDGRLTVCKEGTRTLISIKESWNAK